jgi:endonuclease/exonuclease/phosphatase family metal-dependent hydrolase
MNPFEANLETEDTNLETEVDLEKNENEKLLKEEKEKKIKYCIRFIVIFCFIFVIISILLLFILSNPSTPNSNKTQILSWNLKDFGITKLNDGTKMKAIQHILFGYDIILLSELEQSECDINEECPMKLYFRETFSDYHFIMSPSLGRGIDNRGKEQYGFLIHKKFTFNSDNMGSYEDMNQVFARKPYYIFIKELGLYFANVHITASSSIETRNEVIELFNFFQSIPGQIVLMGDLNLCNPSVVDGEMVRQHLVWLLGDQVMTNMNQGCAYDRIISKDENPKFQNAGVIVDSRIADLQLSDHYPIVLTVSA